MLREMSNKATYFESVVSQSQPKTGVLVQIKIYKQNVSTDIVLVAHFSPEDIIEHKLYN